MTAVLAFCLFVFFVVVGLGGGVVCLLLLFLCCCFCFCLFVVFFLLFFFVWFGLFVFWVFFFFFWGGGRGGGCFRVFVSHIFVFLSFCIIVRLCGCQTFLPVLSVSWMSGRLAGFRLSFCLSINNNTRETCLNRCFNCRLMKFQRQWPTGWSS